MKDPRINRRLSDDIPYRASFSRTFLPFHLTVDKRYRLTSARNAICFQIAFLSSGTSAFNSARYTDYPDRYFIYGYTYMYELPRGNPHKVIETRYSIARRYESAL